MVNKLEGSMKRFLMFLVIAIAVVSLGLTIYYFSTDNEVIYIKSSYLVVQKGDYIQTDGENGLLEFKNRSKYTTLNYGLQQEEHEDATQNVLSYSEEGYYLALNGGESKIVITTNNRAYSKLVIDVMVCDGSAEYPYILKTEEDLKKIGKDEKYPTSASYKLGNDIELTDPWTPIPSYSGVFDGNYFTIKNMRITSASVDAGETTTSSNSAYGSKFTPVVGAAETNAGFVSVLTSSGVIKNLFLIDLSIDVNEEYVGAFAGTNQGTIQTSEATGVIINTVSGKTCYVGGIAGRNIWDTSKAKIDRCGFEGTIFTNGTQQIAGGVVGLNQSGMVSECYYRGLVKNGESNFGGIVGSNKGTTSATADIYDSYFYLKETDSTKTVLSRLAGVVYTNSNASDSNKNMITGCYYGGELTDSVNICADTNPVSQANGYLTKDDFINKAKFITTLSSTNKTTRTWNFNTVWEIPASASYPILNVYSSVGSSYIIDISDIVTGTDVITAQQLYNVLAGKEGYTEKTYKLVGEQVNDEYVIDLNPTNAGGFVWGDESHPIPESFDRQIINPNGVRITNLTIKNNTANSNVGLVKTLGASAAISGLIIDNVTIIGENGNYVGVLAGYSQGASVLDVTITNVDVNISGTGFGTLFGYAGDYEGHGIKDVTVKFVESTNGYFVYAGGIAGINMGTITATTEVYNYVYDANLLGNFVGGVAGTNGGDISYTTAYDIQFNTAKTATTINNVYSGKYNVFVGGLVGINEFKTPEGVKSKGNIVDVYTNINVTAETGANYNLYFGGVAGYNSNNIARAYVQASTFSVLGNHCVFVGGVTGYNNGKIAYSVVDNNCRISTQIVSSVGASKDSTNYILNTSNCSIVGGIVGYDALTSNSTYSIYGCASYAKEVKGYYAGGITGISFGKVERSFCGESKKSNGGVSITGYLTGGIVGVVGGGFVKDCYAFASLYSANYSGKYSGVLSVVKMEVSAMAGITVFALNKGTIVSGCYAVVNFNGTGVSYGSSADLTGYTRGTVSNCVYQNAGSIATSYGTKLTANQLKGSDSYGAFNRAIGGSSKWQETPGNYPTLDGINVRFPSANLPIQH